MVALAAGAYACLVDALEWEDLAVRALWWIPGGPRNALPLAAQLIRARPALVTPLLRRLLLQDTAAAVGCAGVAGMTWSGENGGGGSDGSVPHPTAVSASVSVSCLHALLHTGNGAAVAELVDAAGSAGVRLRGASRRSECLAAVAACAGHCLAFSPAATQETGWSAAVRASCRALAGLLAAGPDAGQLAPGLSPNEEAADRDPSASRAVREAQPLLQSVSSALQCATARAMQLLQSERHQQHSEEEGAVAGGEGGGGPARELFQSCCSLRLQLAGAGVTEASSSPRPDTLGSPAPAVNTLPSTGSAGGSRACSYTQRPWQEAVLLQRPSHRPARTEPTDAQHGQSSDFYATPGKKGGCTDLVGEGAVGEALLRALPGRRRGIVQLQLQSLCTDSRPASHAILKSSISVCSASAEHQSLVRPGAEPASTAGVRLEASSQAPLAAAPPYSALQVRSHLQPLLSVILVQEPPAHLNLLNLGCLAMSSSQAAENSECRNRQHE